jgi:hypothetical protein
LTKHRCFIGVNRPVVARVSLQSLAKPFLSQRRKGAKFITQRTPFFIAPIAGERREGLRVFNFASWRLGEKNS